MTCHELARRLGIQPCHVLANELVDLAEAKDRAGYREKLDQLADKHGNHYRQLVSGLAQQQYRMQTNDHRFTAWRTAWTQNKSVRG